MSAPATPEASGALSVRQLTWFGAAALAVLFTFVAFKQQPNTDAAPHALGPLDWLLHPISSNNFAHQPTVTQNMRAIATIDGSPLVWVVGDGNLIIRSTDSGRTWQQAAIDSGSASAGVDSSEIAELYAIGLRYRAQRLALEDSVAQLRRRLAFLENAAPSNAAAQEKEELSKEQMSKQQQANVYNQRAPSRLNTGNAAEITRGRRELQRVEGRLTALLQAPPSPQMAQVPTAPSVVNLHDVHFISPAQGFAVGDYGTFLTTTDSGRTWKRNPTLRASRLALIHFANARNGFVLAPDDGSTFTTSDGGASWSRYNIDSGDTIRAAGIAGDTLLWLQVDSSRAYISRDLGRTWSRGAPLFSVDTDEDAQGLINAVGIRWATLRRGNLPQERVPRSLEQVFEEVLEDSAGSSLLPASDTVVVVIEDKSDNAWVIAGGLYQTTNRGKSWSHVVSRRKLGAIHFFDANNGWAASESGVLLRTRDGGKTWKTVRTSTADDFVNLFFLDRRTGYAATRDGDLFHTSNGRSWQEVTREPEDVADIYENRSVSAFDSLGAVVQTDGTLRRLRKLNGSWQVDTVALLTAIDRFQSASFVDPRHGAAVNEYGSLMLTSDSGRTWLPHMFNTAGAPAAAVALFDRDSMFVLDADGALRLATIQDPLGTIVVDHNTPTRVAIAPWYYIAMVLLLVLAFLLSRTSGDVRSAIEGRFASDRPLEPEDRDDLGVKPIARALSRFLRNTRTRPPLTLAITGKWGSGKSSLLNLTQADLRKYGLRPVWFNAWHHQKEDSLLAALLDTIRKEAIPPMYTFAGLSFRARLIGIRFRRHWWAFAVVLLPGYFFARLFFSEAGAFDFLHTLDLLSTDLAKLAKGVTSGERLDIKLLGQSVTVLIWPIIAIATAYTKILRAFGVNPAALLSARAGTGKVRDLSAQTGFRHEFAHEFRDVTRALGMYRLVIIVDDLDRCRPANVLDVLEAINFLVSSGECFILLGIDRDQVVSYVGMAFKDAAAELAAQSKEHPDSRFVNMSEAAVRSWYAQEYLDKLINLDIAVPGATADKVKDVLAPPVIPIERARKPWRDRVRPTRARLVAASIAVIIASSSFIAITWDGGVPEPESIATTDSAVASPDTTSTTDVAASSDVASPDTVVAVPKPEAAPVIVSEAHLFAPVLADRRLSSATISLVLFALILLWRFLRQPDPVVRDSESFVLGVRACGPLIFGRRQTPRAAKKFLNRVRYYAMRQRPEQPDARMLDSIVAAINRKLGRAPNKPDVAPPRPGYDLIPEQLLVALAAVHDHNPGWTSSDAFWSNPADFLTAKLPADVAGDLPAKLRAFGDVIHYRDDFDDLVRDIR